MDKTKLAVNLFDKYANQYQEKYMDVSMYKDSYDIFCNAIEQQNATVLELACGPGNITKYLLEQRPDLKILATDLAPKMIELAKVNVPNAAFKLMDCKAINELNTKYDAIMCGFGLPYLTKEEAKKLISDAANILSPDGILYLSTMEGDYSKSGLKGPSSGGDDKLFMHFHQVDYLTSTLKNNGFNIIDLQRKVLPSQDEASDNDLIIIAKKLPL